MLVIKNANNATKREPDLRDLVASVGNIQKINSFYSTTSERQIGGAFKSVRVFGGQIAAQSYIVAKLHRNDSLPLSINLMFYSAGSTANPIEYHVEASQPDDSFMQVVSKQGKRLLSCANVRLGKKTHWKDVKPHLNMPSFPSHVSLKCPTFEEVLRKMPLDDWLLENRKSFRLSKNEPSQQIFELRIPDPYHCVGLSHDTKPMMIWLRLKHHMQNVKFADKMIVPLLMSDYVVGHPGCIAFDQRRIVVKTMASVTHKVIFHSDDFDPYDYFLTILDIQNVKGVALVEGHLFARNGMPVLTYIQQSLFQVDHDLKQDMSKL